MRPLVSDGSKINKPWFQNMVLSLSLSLSLSLGVGARAGDSLLKTAVFTLSIGTDRSEQTV